MRKLFLIPTLAGVEICYNPGMVKSIEGSYTNQQMMY
jgi:hypothetical protein